MKWEGGKEEVEIQLYMYFIWRERGKGGEERGVRVESTVMSFQFSPFGIIDKLINHLSFLMTFPSN